MQAQILSVLRSEPFHAAAALFSPQSRSFVALSSVSSDALAVPAAAVVHS